MVNVNNTTKRNDAGDTKKINSVKTGTMNVNNTPETRQNDAAIIAESNEDSDKENAHKQLSVVSDVGG